MEVGRQYDNQNDTIVGIDIGTSKIAVVIASNWQRSKIEIQGIGVVPSKGLHKGIVENVAEATESVRKAIDIAEHMAGVKVKSAMVGIAGGHISGQNSNGIVSIPGPSPKVTQSDVDRVIEVAKARTIPVDRAVIHVVPQWFLVDGGMKTLSPVDTPGSRLEASVRIITGLVAGIDNVIRCVENAGVTVSPESVVLESIASSQAVLTEDDRKDGVALADIGAGTTDLAIYRRGALQYTATINVGGKLFTDDIAKCFNISSKAAEELKKRYACVCGDMVDPESTVQVPTIPGEGYRPSIISVAELAWVSQVRMSELLFDLIYQEILYSRQEVLSGVVITGGTSQINGLLELAESLEGLDLNLRIGYPNTKEITGLSDRVNSPVYATSIGLVMLAAVAAEERRDKLFETPADENRFSSGPRRLDEILKRMKEWLTDYF